MVLGALESLLDINFAPDIDINCLNFTKVEGGDRLKKDGRTLHLNLDALEPETRREVLTVASEQVEEEGRLLRDEEEVETRAIESGFETDHQEILDYFDGVLSERILAIIEASLYLRGLIEERDLGKEEIRERKRDIARRHGPEAIYLSSLVSAGYFDPDGGVRDMFVNMGVNEGYSKYDFQDVLLELSEKKLLCVFVENDDNVSDVVQTVRSRLAKYQQEDPINDWFDIRGIGDDCEEIIDGVMERLEEEFIAIDYAKWANGDDHWVRIRPGSLQTISP